MLRSRIPQITREMLPAVAIALRAGAQVVADEASDRAPRGGGIHHIADDILEHGSVHAAPRPFLVPALEAKRAEVVADVRAAIKRAVR